MCVKYIVDENLGRYVLNEKVLDVVIEMYENLGNVEDVWVMLCFEIELNRDSCKRKIDKRMVDNESNENILDLLIFDFNFDVLYIVIRGNLKVEIKLMLRNFNEK